MYSIILGTTQVNNEFSRHTVPNKGYDEFLQQNHFFFEFYHATQTFTLFASFPKYNFVANILKLIHVLNYFRNDLGKQRVFTVEPHFVILPCNANVRPVR